MRWRALLAAATLVLTGCGSLEGAPRPLASDLLGAPVRLNLGGQLLTGQADVALSGGRVGVRFRAQAARAPLPPLSVTEVYLVSASGVWWARVPASAQLGCGAGRCVQGTVSGSARGLRPGQRAQAIARLRDGAGRTLWLRDAQVELPRKQ